MRDLVEKVRLGTAEQTAFAAACKRVGEPKSRILRDLMRAVPAYVDTMGGRWYPPRLAQEIPEAAAGVKRAGVTVRAKTRR